MSSPSGWVSVTVHSSRLRTGSPASVTRWRSLRRVATTSPGWACSPPPIATRRSGLRWPASRRAVWIASVDGVDVFVGAGGDRDRVAVGVVCDPFGGDRRGVFGEGAGDHPAVFEVGVQPGRVAVSQLQRRGRLPRCGEAVDVFELDAAGGGAELVEHAAASDGLQLAWVTDQRQAPVVGVGELRSGCAGCGCRSSPPHPRSPSPRAGSW